MKTLLLLLLLTTTLIATCGAVEFYEQGNEPIYECHIHGKIGNAVMGWYVKDDEGHYYCMYCLRDKLDKYIGQLEVVE